MTTIQTLFGPEEVRTSKPKSIRFKQIKAVYETMIIKEEITNDFWPATRYTSPDQMFQTFKSLRQEAREYRYYSYRAN
jgi:DNA repair protein RadC